MRRLRNISPALPSAAMERLGAAVMASIAAHALLIYGFALPDGSRPGLREIVIHARLDTAKGSASAPFPEAVAPYVLRTRKLVTLPNANPEKLPPEISGAALPEVHPSISKAEAGVTGDAVPANAASSPVLPGSDSEIAAMPDPVHYEARELDVYPRTLRPITPTYPVSARDAQLAGSVTLMVMIDEGGRVVSASVLDAEPEGVFDQAARDAVAEIAFYPAQRNGRTVRSQILIKVEFDPRPVR